MPRMTNTFMRGGSDDPAELLSRVKKGIFAKSFGGGQVDIVSGKFTFTCTEAYQVENGKLTADKITVTEGKSTKTYDNLNDVPKAHRDAVEKLIGRVRGK